jgi:hypothetical protein
MDIEGTIGRLVLTSIATTDFADHRLLRVFRDFLEARLENTYNVMTTLSIQEDGFIEFTNTAHLTKAELDRCAMMSLVEFRKNPINEAKQ